MPATNLKTFFEQPYNRTEWITVLKEHIGDVTFLAKPPAVKIKTNNYNATAAELGSFETEEGFVIGLYEVSVPERAKLTRNKRTLRDLLSLEYKNTVDAALVVFYQEHSGKWRFSYVSELKTHATDPKRFTYLLGEGEKCKTIADHFAGIRKKYSEKKQPIPLAALNEVFNVSSMSKEFFDEYRELYGKFTSYLTGEDEDGNKTGRSINGFATYFPGDADAAKKDARDFIKKMMGRIVFLYFLQKKGWLGVPKDEQWGTGDPEFMSKLYKDCKEPEIFYSQVLVPLFYDTLNNTERTDELFKIKPSVFKNGNYHQLKIPYLNGGLFEDDQPKTDLLVFKKELFQELFDFFDRYNFTVEEDSDREHTVAVDPEMLGHIFENLLEDNKDKGAFYTPKEIVHYMCRESLVEYLYTALTDKYGIQEEGLREKLDAFIRNDKAAEVGDYIEELAQALYDVKICDPAIGSGAFPMGLLKEIVEAVAALAAEDQPTVRRIWKYKGEFADNLAHIKEQIIENCIYGVDIEKGAVDIARLRFWLSLVVDENAPKPLPNLDYRIVVGNSLVSKFEEEIIEIDWNIKPNIASGVEKIVNDQQGKLHLLQVQQHEYFVAHAQKEKIRQNIRDLKIDILINQLQLSKISFQQANPLLGGYAPTAKEIQKNTENKIKIAGYDQLIQKLQRLKQNKNSILDYFDWKLDFPDVLNEKVTKGIVGFDIVIGNPPYVSAVTMARDEKTKKFFKEKYPLATGSYDLYLLFLLKGNQLASLKGTYTWIIPNKFLIAEYANKTKSELIKNSGLMYSINVSTFNVFDGIGVYPIIIFGSRSKQSQFQELLLEEYNHLTEKVFTYPKKLDSHKKIRDFGIEINSGATGFQAQQLTEIISSKSKRGSIPFAVSGNIDRYSWTNESVRYMGNKYNIAFINNTTDVVATSKWQFWNNPKIIIAGMTKVIEAVYVEEPLGIGVGVYGIYNFGPFDPYCLTAVLNSKYLTYYFLIKFKDKHLAGGYLAINKSTIEEFPLVEIPKKTQKKLCDLSKKAHELVIEEKSIKKYEEQIDHLVYRLYELTYDQVIEIDPEFSLSEKEYDDITIE